MEGVLQIESTNHLRASIKLLLAERRARADRRHTETVIYIVYIFNVSVDIDAKDILDNLFYVHEKHN